MDMLFDYENGNSVKSIDGNILRTAVTDMSLYLLFWDVAIKVFESVYFINKINEKKSVPPCVKNWISTLRGFILYL